MGQMEKTVTDCERNREKDAEREREMELKTRKREREGGREVGVSPGEEGLSAVIGCFLSPHNKVLRLAAALALIRN